MKPQYCLHAGGTVHAVALLVEVDVPRKLLFIEEMPDGRLRVTYSKALNLSVADLESLSVREVRT